MNSTKDWLIASTEGCRIITQKADIILDPVCPKDIGKAPHAVIFSHPRAAADGIDILSEFSNVPVFTSGATKKIINLHHSKYNNLIGENASHKLCTDEIIDCRLKTKNRIRKKGNIICEFTLFGNSELPGTVSVLIKTENNTVLYTSDTLVQTNTLPPHDIAIISVQKKAPLEILLQKVPELSVKINDFSRLYDVLSFFNNSKMKVNVGIDDTVIFPACEYLKLDCTVFSETVKPLSSFKTMPPVIITATPSLYKNRPSISDFPFFHGASLSELYSLAASTKATRVIAVCAGAVGIHRRGNLTICENNTVIEL